MSHDHHKLLLTEPEVRFSIFIQFIYSFRQYFFFLSMKIRWAQQQVVKRRIKRSVFDAQANNGLGNHRVNRSPTIFNLNDPGWSQMWYLVSTHIRMRFVRNNQSIFFDCNLRTEETDVI